MTTETKTPEPLERHPQDFCRTCYGKGGFRETERGVVTWTPCGMCRGTGWGH